MIVWFNPNMGNASGQRAPGAFSEPDGGLPCAVPIAESLLGANKNAANPLEIRDVVFLIVPTND